MNLNESRAKLRCVSYRHIDRDLLGKIDALLAELGDTHGFSSSCANGEGFGTWVRLRVIISELGDIPTPARCAQDIVKARSRILTVLCLLKKLEQYVRKSCCRI